MDVFYVTVDVTASVATLYKHDCADTSELLVCCSTAIYVICVLGTAIYQLSTEQAVAVACHDQTSRSCLALNC